MKWAAQAFIMTLRGEQHALVSPSRRRCACSLLPRWKTDHQETGRVDEHVSVAIGRKVGEGRVATPESMPLATAGGSHESRGSRAGNR